MTFGMPVVDAVFWGVVTFSILVVLHEGGHFLAARAFGVKVHEFMVGLPGPAIRFKGKKTTYGITAIPLGGYVRIAGQEPGAEDPLLAEALWEAASRERIDAAALAPLLGVDGDRAGRLLLTLQDYDAVDAAKDDDVSYLRKVEPGDGETPETFLARLRSGTYRGLKTWQRVTILVMGVAVNLVTAVIVLTVVLAQFGYFDLSLAIDGVVEGSGAAEAGLREGDTIVSVAGERVSDWQELMTVVGSQDPGSSVEVTYERGGELRSTKVSLREQEGRPLLGVRPGVVHREFGLWGALQESFRFIGMVFRAIAGFFDPDTFQVSVRNATSVVGASVVVAEAAQAGPLEYAWIVAVLSLSLGALNILPIPPLDGGRIVIELVERAMGRPMRREVSLGISLTGALLLFSLIGYLVYSDILRLSGAG